MTFGNIPIEERNPLDCKRIKPFVAGMENPEGEPGPVTSSLIRRIQ